MLDRIEFGHFELTPEIERDVNAVLKSGWLTMGPTVKEFERRFCNLFGYKYAKLVGSGTAADTIACMCLEHINGAKEGDEVICPALSFIASANSIRSAGLRPVFVDVLKGTLGINENLIEQAITSRTKAIMAVNLMGRPVELDVIQDIAKRHNLIVIVDNCEAYGSKFKNKFSLEYGDFETTSHFSAHISMCCEGGSLASTNEESDGLIDSIRSHGRKPGSLYFDHSIWGLNFKNTDIHAAVGLSSLTYENFWTNFNQRKYNMRVMREACRGFENLAYFIEEDENRQLAPHAFSITLKREGITHLISKLDKANIAWKRNFGSMPEHGCFKSLGYSGESCPNAHYVGENGIHIGVHRYLTDSDLDRICTTLREFFQSY